jgi:hypothetical protein
MSWREYSALSRLGQYAQSISTLMGLPRPGLAGRPTSSTDLSSRSTRRQNRNYPGSGRAEFLSQLMFCSASISASKRVSSTGAVYSLRVNPSPGNLHPTEFHFARTFFDERVNRYLNLSPEEGQVVYHFAIGYPVSDPRLEG